MYVPVNGRAIRLGRTPDAVNGAVLRAYSVLRAWRLIRLSVYLMWVAKEGKRFSANLANRRVPRYGM